MNLDDIKRIIQIQSDRLLADIARAGLKVKFHIPDVFNNSTDDAGEIDNTRVSSALGPALIYISEDDFNDPDLSLIVKHELIHTLQWQNNKRVAKVLLHRIFRNLESSVNLGIACFGEGFARYLERANLDSPMSLGYIKQENFLKYLLGLAPSILDVNHSKFDDDFIRPHIGGLLFFLVYEKAYGRKEAIKFGLDGWIKNKDELYKLFEKAWIRALKNIGKSAFELEDIQKM